mmetsp:Transcript_40410/g.68920  ORF Transcript_40410/g.68920 Transcript_40410/m.68920 type:complete len:120 (-) Transcript_40410:550-909(-)
MPMRAQSNTTHASPYSYDLNSQTSPPAPTSTLIELPSAFTATCGNSKISQSNLTISSGGQHSGTSLTSFSISNVEVSDINFKTTFLVRDARGNVFHKESSEDVDCYKSLRNCFGYFAFV